MSVHDAARRLATVAVDAPLGDYDRERLDEHLAGCQACRGYVDALRHDTTVLGRLDFGDAPATVRTVLTERAVQTGRSTSRAGGGFALLAATGLLLVAAIGGMSMGAGGRGNTAVPSAGTGEGGTGPAVAGNAVHWRTDVVDLRAREFWLDAGGRRFHANVADLKLASASSGTTYWSLQLLWLEDGLLPRLDLYFGSDGKTWWIDHVWAGEGSAEATPLFAHGPSTRVAVGEPFAGDIDLELDDLDDTPDDGTARLHLGGARIDIRPASDQP